MQFRLLLLHLFSLLIAQASCRYTNSSSSNVTVSTIWSWPVGSWAENIAVRRNGKLLVTRLDVPQVWQVDPEGANATLVYDFPSSTGCLGITEVTRDVFAVVAGNYSLTTGAAVPGSFAIWTLDVRGYPRRSPQASLAASVVDAEFLNGLTTLPFSNGTVLAADSSAGVVYSIDTNTGDYSIVLSDDSMLPPPNATLQIGVNGVHIRGGYLYYTNSVTFTFNRVKINSDGTADGPYEVVYGDNGPTYDDFSFSRKGNAYVAHVTSYGLVRITPEGEGSVILADVDVTLGTTSSVFSRHGKQTLYLATSGGLAAGFTDPARVVAIDGLD